MTSLRLPSGQWPDTIPRPDTDHIDDMLRELSRKMEREIKRQARRAAARAAAAAAAMSAASSAFVLGLAGALVIGTPGMLADGTCGGPCYPSGGGSKYWGGWGGRVPKPGSPWGNPNGGGYPWNGGGNGYYGGGSMVWAPPPPPPPPWKEILAAVLATEHARPVAEATTDSELEQFVDDSLTRAIEDLQLTDSKLKRYFRYFPTFQDSTDRRREFGDYLNNWDDQPESCLTGNESWAYYHPLDSQGRSTGVTACLSAEQIDYRGRGRKADSSKKTEIMGGDTKRKNGDVNSNPAPGWAPGDGDDYARGHLLRSQLGGNGRDRRNLVRLHHVANSQVMKSYEDIVRRRLDSGERIFYASIPQYDGSNPVPETVDLYAVGDRGFYAEWTVYNTEDGLPPGNGWSW